jgi:hypothetical protein
MSDARVIDEILTEGEDDWVHLGVLVRIVKYATGLAGEDLLCKTLGVIQHLVSSGWMVAGDIGDEVSPGFQPWSLTLAEALARIEREWRDLGRDPSLGDICWFANTPAGDERARLLRSE